MDSRQKMRVQDADGLERLQAEFEASKHSPSARTSNLRSPASPSVQHPSRATAAAAAAPTSHVYQPLMVLGSIVEKGIEHLNAGSEGWKDGVKPPQPTAQSFPQARHRSAGRVSQPPLLPRQQRLAYTTYPYTTHHNSMHLFHMQPFEQTCTNIPNIGLPDRVFLPSMGTLNSKHLSQKYEAARTREGAGLPCSKSGPLRANTCMKHEAWIRMPEQVTSSSQFQTLAQRQSSQDCSKQAEGSHASVHERDTNGKPIHVREGGRPAGHAAGVSERLGEQQGPNTGAFHGRAFRNDRGKIHEENKAIVAQMSAASVAEAQREIASQLSPALVEKLRRKGAGDTSRGDKKVTQAAQEEVAGLFLEVGRWEQRVEAIRHIRFSLEGDILPPQPAGDAQVLPQVGQRDILRSDGQPDRGGYTLLEASALARSAIAPQRALACRLLCAVLTLATPGGPAAGGADWEAVWTYALGPQLLLGPTLRMALDDSHDTVLLAAVQALNCLLTSEANEKYAEASQGLWGGERCAATCPIFRKKGRGEEGLVGGGRWKDSVKPSEFLPAAMVLPAEEEEEEEEEGEGVTVGEDADVASRDVAAGLIKMGVLPRIRYLMEVVALPALDDHLLRLLLALARHSPSLAWMVHACPRLLPLLHTRFVADALTPGCAARQLLALRLLKVLCCAGCSTARSSGWAEALPMGLLSRGTTSPLCREALQLWRVVGRYRLRQAVWLWGELYPALCTALEPPGEGGGEEGWGIAADCFLVAEALAGALPPLRADPSCVEKEGEGRGEEEEGGERWSWAQALPLLHQATHWLDPTSVAHCVEGGGWMEALGAACHLMATAVKASEVTGSPGWRPPFVDSIAEKVVQSGALGGGSMGGLLTLSREGGRAGLSALACLHGLLRLLFELKGAGVGADRLYEGAALQAVQAEVERQMEGGKALAEAEVGGRGGPAPGVGAGWGAHGGGWFSTAALVGEERGRVAVALGGMGFWSPAGLITALGCLGCTRRREVWEGLGLLLGDKETEGLLTHYRQTWVAVKGGGGGEARGVQWLLEESVGQRLPLPPDWLFSCVARGANATVIAVGLRLLLSYESNPPTARCLAKIPLTRKLHALSEVFMAEGDVYRSDAIRQPVEALQLLYGRQLAHEEVQFEVHFGPSYSVYAETLAQQFGATSFGDELFGRQVALLLMPQVGEKVRVAVWHTLVDTQALSLLPPLNLCLGGGAAWAMGTGSSSSAMAEECLKSWRGGELKQARARGAASYTLALRHLAKEAFGGQGESVVGPLLRAVQLGAADEDMLRDLVGSGGRAGAVLEQRIRSLSKACRGEDSLVQVVASCEEALSRPVV